MSTSAPYRRRFELFLLVAACIAAFALVQGEEGRQFAQARENLAFRGGETLGQALEGYPNVWMPLYPIVGWIEARLKLNLLFFFGLIWLSISFVRRHSTNVSAIVPAVLLAASRASYGNVHQAVAETMFALIALGSMTVLADRRTRGGAAFTVKLGILAALASLTRHFGLLWVGPLSGLCVLLAHGRDSLRRAVTQGALYAAVVTAVVGPWLLHVKAKTGYYSGANRTTPRRNLPEVYQHWNDQVDFGTNVLFTAKTILIDLFSPVRLAAHEVVEAASTGSERVVFAGVAVLVVAALSVLAFAVKPISGEEAPGWRERLLAPRALPAVFAVSYPVVLITAWSFTNNDPIYTRHLFPIYPFLFLTFVSIYSVTKERMRSPWARAPLVLLLATYLVTNVMRFDNG